MSRCKQISYSIIPSLVAEYRCIMNQNLFRRSLVLFVRSVAARLAMLSKAIWIVPALAETSTGRISGAVTDPSDVAVVNAKVVGVNPDTTAVGTVAADANGFYTVTNLPIGNYSVDVTVEGFKTQSKRGIALVADGRVTVDFRLEIGSLQQTVEIVSSKVENLNTVSGEISRVIDTKQVDNLTMNGRNYVHLMTMIPGLVVTNPDQFATTTSLASNNQSINGNRADSNNLTGDGGYNSVAGSNSSLVNNCSPDFMQEVKLQTSNFSE